MIPPGFDRETLLRVTGNDEGLSRELVSLLLSELPAHRRRLCEAATERDHPRLARAAHTLAGGAAYCGALELKRRAAALEDALGSGAVHDPGALLESLLAEIDRLLETTHHG